jgi:hypothetical protein
MIDKICIFHCIGLYSSYKDLLIIPSVISQLLSPFALVNQATYFMDRIQKEKKKSFALHSYCLLVWFRAFLLSCRSKKGKNVDSSSSGDRFWDYFAVMRVLPDMTVWIARAVVDNDLYYIRLPTHFISLHESCWPSLPPRGITKWVGGWRIITGTL